MNILKHIILIFVFGISINTYSQVSIEATIQKINKVYQNQTSYEANVLYQIFDTNGVHILESKNGKLKIMGSNRYSKIGEIEIIGTKSYILQVDNGLKTIILMPNETGEKHLNSNYVGIVKRALGACSSVNNGNNKKQGWIKMDSCMFSGFTGIELFFDSKSHLINKVGLDKGKEGKMVISYSKVKTGNDINIKYFGIEDYLVGLKAKAQLKIEYKNYAFTNYFKWNLKYKG